MALSKVAGTAVPGTAQPSRTFNSAFKWTKEPSADPERAHLPENLARPVVDANGSTGVPPPLPPRASPSGAAAKMVAGVQEAQRRLDRVMELAASGRTFSPAQLLSIQAQVYRSSQELDLAGKVVDRASGGLKQVLQTSL
ncbi:MAG TPA: ATP-dependent helicase HrpB [Myxococcaceae bacterium]|nr:ATP-dependent helicase HrpB [Myxococcaceae bacterium]